MELNEDVKFLLDLKFNTLEEMVKAFKAAIGAPRVFADDPGVRQEVLMRAVSLWAQEGAPNKFEITEQNVNLILEVKFGSIERAYRHWILKSDPDVYSNLTQIEYNRMLNYIAKD